MTRTRRMPWYAAVLFAHVGCTKLVGSPSLRADAAADGAVATTDAACIPDHGVPTGTRDPEWLGGTFVVPTPNRFGVRGALLDPGGRLYLYGGTGDCAAPGSGADLAVIRHNADGTLDTRFGTRGYACWEGPSPSNQSDQFLGGAVDAQGRVYLVGQSGTPRDTQAVVVRLDESGRLDPAFNGGRVLTFRPTLAPGTRTSGEFAAFAAVAGVDGLYVAGADFGFASNADSLGFVARVNADGTLDTAFAGAEGAVDATVAGWFALGRSRDALYVAGMRRSDRAAVVRRIGLDGRPDAGFGTDGYAAALQGMWGQPRDLEVLFDGSVVVAAASGTPDINESRAAAARFTPAGALDEGFGARGVYTSMHYLNPQYEFAMLAAQCDGRVILGAQFRRGVGSSSGYAERLDARGRLDLGFSPTGGVAGDETTHGPAAVLVDPRTQWVYLVTRSGHDTGYSIYRYAP